MYDHAPQHQQQTAAEGDGKRPRQAFLSVRELRHQSAIGMLKPFSIPRSQLAGPVQDLLLGRHGAIGSHALRAPAPFRRPQRKDRDVESPLLGEHVLHAAQQRGFFGVPVAGIAAQLRVDFHRELIEALASRLIAIVLCFCHELLDGLVIASGSKATVRRASACAPRGRA